MPQRHARLHAASTPLRAYARALRTAAMREREHRPQETA